MKLPFCLATIIFAAAGCTLLPPGEPPLGNVTDNFFPDPDTAAARREYMIAALSAALLTRCAPGDSVTARSDAATAEDFDAVLRQCRKITGINFCGGAKLQLFSRRHDGRWIITLTEAEKELQSVEIKL